MNCELKQMLERFITAMENIWEKRIEKFYPFAALHIKLLGLVNFVLMSNKIILVIIILYVS